MNHRVQPTRILMTSDTVGGVWTYAFELSQALSADGVEVALATMGPSPTPGQREEVRRLPNVTLIESRFKLEWMQDPWNDIKHAGQWLLSIEKEFRPDVVHLNSYTHGALPWDAPAMIAGHSCVLSWWQAVRGESAPPAWNRYFAEVASGLHGAALLVAPSKAMLGCLKRHYGRFRSERVIPNGRHSSLFEPAAKERIVFAAGRLWDEAKNIQAVDEVARRLSWPVYVAGDDAHPEGGRFTCSNITLLGRLDIREICRWYARASIFTLPARYEPFGLTVLEAALSGCALVLGDIPSLRENWDGAALFAPPENADALAEALEMLIADESHRIALASMARSRALQFTPERMAAGYLDAYRSIMNNH